jgi:hypothetical protein
MEKNIFMAVIFHKNLREMKRRYGWSNRVYSVEA